MTAANPYTAALLRALPDADPNLRSFVAHWDRVETLILDVYRRGEASAADEAEWRALRGWLTGHPLPGVPAPDPNPFDILLHNPRALDFVGNRAALRSLPDARAALNGRLLAAGQTVTTDRGSAGA